jgi:hypothetical protein
MQWVHSKIYLNRFIFVFYFVIYVLIKICLLLLVFPLSLSLFFFFLFKWNIISFFLQICKYNLIFDRVYSWFCIYKSHSKNKLFLIINSLKVTFIAWINSKWKSFMHFQLKSNIVMKINVKTSVYNFGHI